MPLSALDELCTHCPLPDCYENSADCPRRKALGLPIRKSNDPSTSPERDAEIRQRYARGGVSYRDLGREYDLHFSTIGDIIHRRRARDK